jgi:hypothetical protein
MREDINDNSITYAKVTSSMSPDIFDTRPVTLFAQSFFENLHNKYFSEKENKEMDIDCKTKMEYTDSSCLANKNGTLYYIMPNILDVQVYNDKCVEVLFTDGTTERATVCGGDTYSLEQGISICITKKLISMKCDSEGSAIYNKIIKNALRVYKDNRNKEEMAQREIERIEAKIEKLKAKSAAKRAKRLQAQREEQIEIQKEAYLRAMREFNDKKTGE